MILNIQFQVEIPDEKLERAIASMGYTKLIPHAYEYLNNTLYKAFHKDGVQEVKNVKMSVEKL